METHANPETDISLQGYYVFRGIAVLDKESFRNACKFDPLSDSDIIWVRVQKQITKLSSDFIPSICIFTTFYFQLWLSSW